MKTNIRELFVRAAANPSWALDGEALLRRGRHLRYQRRIIGALSSLAVVGAAVWTVSVFSLDTGRDSAPKVAPAGQGIPLTGPEGYKISVSSVSLEREGKARVEFSIGWSGNAYPGVVSCTVAVSGQDGKPIGDKTIPTLSRTTPENGTMDTGVIVDDVPSAADVECGERLDDPDGFHEMTNIEVERPNPESDELLVYFDSRWNGDSETPGVSDCNVTVYASKGTSLLEHEFTYSGGLSMTAIPLSLTLPSEVTATPASAKVGCSPLGIPD